MENEVPFAFDFWATLRSLTHAFEADLAVTYSQFGVDDLRPRHAPALLALGNAQPQTIRELASAAQVTHSAMSQTISSLRSAGYVETTPGADARTRAVRLTAKGATVLKFVAAEWTATERALRDLDASLPYSLLQALADMRTETDRLPLRDRVIERLLEAGFVPDSEKK